MIVLLFSPVLIYILITKKKKTKTEAHLNSEALSFVNRKEIRLDRATFGGR